MLQIMGTQLQIYCRMEEGFSVTVHLGYDGSYIL